VRFLGSDLGYPVPFIAYIDPEGVPHFPVTDQGKRAKAIRNDLCGICGTRLLRGRWFIGGPASAFDKGGVYVEPPFHRECAVYALSPLAHIGYLPLPGLLHNPWASARHMLVGIRDMLRQLTVMRSGSQVRTWP
jgi:hypothetical protein